MAHARRTDYSFVASPRIFLDSMAMHVSSGRARFALLTFRGKITSGREFAVSIYVRVSTDGPIKKHRQVTQRNCYEPHRHPQVPRSAIDSLARPGGAGVARRRR